MAKDDEALEQMIRLRYDGAGTFIPPGVAVRELLDRKLVIGECYRVSIYHERSETYHAKYFATIAEAWQHLPNPWDQMLPSPEHLRKYALIKAGWCDSVTLPLKSKSDAIAGVNAARFIDAYCVATATANVLTIFKARSQRKAFQDAHSFYETAVRVFDVIGGIIGVDPLSLYNPKDLKP